MGKKVVGAMRQVPDGPFSRRLANLALVTFVVVEATRCVVMLLSW